MEFPYPLLVCDIGGTNARIASVGDRGQAPRLIAKVKTADYAGFADCVEQALATHRCPRPRAILACGAGPVSQRRLHLTNAAWTIDGPQVADCLGLDQGLLFNDFEAQALALPAHRPDWLHPIGSAQPAEHGPQIILGPGTGLGVAALVREGGMYLPLASEAAHSDFGPTNPEEEAIWRHVELFHGRISAETLISGPGLARLHRARMAAEGAPPGLLDGPGVVAAAKTDPQSREAATVQAFWRLVARFAGDMALTFLARGGVSLAGGILPRIADLVDAEDFRKAFEDKAPMQNLVRDICTSVVMAPDAVLAGMAAIAAQPNLYVINYRDRVWR